MRQLERANGSPTRKTILPGTHKYAMRKCRATIMNEPLSKLRLRKFSVMVGKFDKVEAQEAVLLKISDLEV